MKKIGEMDVEDVQRDLILSLNDEINFFDFFDLLNCNEMPMTDMNFVEDGIVLNISMDKNETLKKCIGFIKVVHFFVKGKKDTIETIDVRGGDTDKRYISIKVKNKSLIFDEELKWNDFLLKNVKKEWITPNNFYYALSVENDGFSLVYQMGLENCYNSYKLFNKGTSSFVYLLGRLSNDLDSVQNKIVRDNISLMVNAEKDSVFQKDENVFLVKNGLKLKVRELINSNKKAYKLYDGEGRIVIHHHEELCSNKLFSRALEWYSDFSNTV